MNQSPRILLALMGLSIGGAETHVVELAIGLKDVGFTPIVASNGGVYVKVLEENGIRHYQVPLNNKSPLNMLRSYQRLEKILKEEHIDLIHAHARIPAFILGFLHKKTKIPFVTTAHWVFDTSFYFKYLTNWGQYSLAVSNDIKKYLMDNYHIPEDHIKVTINGISTKRFNDKINYSHLLKELGLQPNNRHIVYISRMDVSRSLVAHHICEIAPYLFEKYPDIDITLVGDGDDFAQVQKKVIHLQEKYGKNKIVMAGARTNINEFVSMSDFFIGVSRSVMEAMAAGKPVIVSGNEGYIGIFDRDQLEPSVLTNFCCRGQQPATSQLLKRDLTKLLELPEEKLQELKAYGKEVILERYSIQKMTNDNIEVYNLFLNR